jgi:LysM repeat protein
MKVLAAIAAAGVLFGGCALPGPGERTPTPSPGVTLTAYFSPVPDPSRTPVPGRVASPTPLPTPTATPFLYSIVEGDTLIGIAFRFGLTLADILAANPGIDPQFLSIGDDLIIPVLENVAAAAAVPTPVAFVVPTGGTDCYPAADGSLWCFQLFENTGDLAVEGLSARFTVYDSEGEPVDERIGLPPVNLLPPGGSVPLAAWFPEAGQDYSFAGLAVLSALPVRADDPRYVPVSVDPLVELDGLIAYVSGTLTVSDDTPVAEFRIGVIAFDASGRVVGVRVIQVEGPGAEAFSTSVYSLDAEIQRVVVLVEGYPP